MHLSLDENGLCFSFLTGEIYFSVPLAPAEHPGCVHEFSLSWPWLGAELPGPWVDVSPSVLHRELWIGRGEWFMMCEVDVCWQSHGVGGDPLSLYGGCWPGVVDGAGGPFCINPHSSFYVAWLSNSSATSLLSNLDLLRRQKGKSFLFLPSVMCPRLYGPAIL